MLRFMLPLGALIAACAVPASANEGWDLANRTYVEGRQQGVIPVTTAEMLTCGAYWTVWSVTLDGSEFTEEELAGLMPQLHPDTAQMMARAYIPDMEDVPPEQTAEIEGYLAEASALFDAYLDGDEESGGTFFAMLGICHPRAGEGSTGEGSSEKPD